MRYFFESKIEKKDKGYMIQIPFNIWEVCKQRDVIQADVVLDNSIIACELLPLEKGNYEIHIYDEDAVKVDLNKTHKILLHVSGSLIVMNQNIQSVRSTAWKLSSSLKMVFADRHVSLCLQALPSQMLLPLWTAENGRQLWVV